MDVPGREVEDSGNPRGVHAVCVEEPDGHVARVHGLGVARAGKDVVFGHLKLIGYKFKHAVGEFCNLGHGMDIMDGWTSGVNKTARPVFKSYISALTHIAL